MANTYNLIANTVLSSNSVTSVTFSAISNAYTDLHLRVSGRTFAANGFLDLVFEPNPGTGSNSNTVMVGRGSGGWSYYGSIVVPNVVSAETVSSSTETSNTFSNIEAYFPNYLVSASKPVSSFGAGETNATDARMSAVASLFPPTAAISSIQVRCPGGTTAFASGSSFYLYGIKNS